MKSAAGMFLFLCDSSCSLEQINVEGRYEPLMVLMCRIYARSGNVAVELPLLSAEPFSLDPA